MTTKKKGAAVKPAALSPEEFQKLTPEEQLAYLNKVMSANADLEAANAELTKEVTKDLLPTFEVEADEENDIEGGEYEFTGPTFTWDDNTVIDVKTLHASMSSTDKKLAAKAQAMVSALVERKSGIIRRKED